MERKQYNRIKEVLEEKSKDVYWLQSRLDGETIPRIIRWCNNVKQPTIEELHEIAKVLDVDVKDLLVSSDSYPKTSLRTITISKPIVNTRTKDNLSDIKTSLKKHELSLVLFDKNSEFNYYSLSDKSLQWSYKKDESFYNNNAAVFGLSAYLWIIEKLNKEDLCWLLDFLNKRSMSIWEDLQINPEELISEIKHNVPSFRLDDKQYNEMKREIQFAWIDLQSFIMFVNYCTFIMGEISGRSKLRLQSCTSYDDIAALICSEMGLTRTNDNQDVINNKEDELPF